jgi:hypothetical protein
MSSKEEKRLAKLHAAEIKLQQFMRAAEEDLRKERERSARKRAGLPPSHADAEEAQLEEERERQKSKTLKSRFKSMFKRKSRSPPPPAYNAPSVNAPPPAYTPRSRGGTKRGKKTRRIKKTKRRRTLLKGRK